MVCFRNLPQAGIEPTRQAKSKVAGILSDIKSEDISSDFTYYPRSLDFFIRVPFLT